eukprot:s706_g19.t1
MNAIPEYAFDLSIQQTKSLWGPSYIMLVLAIIQEQPAHEPASSAAGASGGVMEEPLAEVDEGEPFALEHPDLMAEDGADKKGTFKDRLT